MKNIEKNTLKFITIEKDLPESFSLKQLSLEWILSLIGIISFVSLLSLSFSINNIQYGILMGAILSIGIQFLYYSDKKVNGIGYSILAFILIVMIFQYRKIFGGFFITANEVIETIGMNYGIIMMKFSIPISEIDYALAQQLFIALITFVFAIPISFSVRYKYSVIPVIYSFIILVVLGMLNGEPSLIFLVFWCVYFTGVVFGAITKDRGITGVFTCATIAICTLFLIGCYFSGFTDKYQGMDIFSMMKSTVVSKIDSVRFRGSSVLPEGDFQNLKGFQPTEKEQLEVVMSSPDSLYLRGFVGSSYTGTGWNSILNSELYKNSELFYWLHEEDFYGQTQISNLAQAVDSSITEELYNNIAVRNLGASSKYMYTPYELIGQEETLLKKNRIGDENILTQKLFGDEYYKYSSLSNQVKQYTALAEKLYNQSDSATEEVKKYINNESHYNEFVYDTYLEIPDNTRNLLKNKLKEYGIDEYNLDENTHLSYNIAKQNILAYLTDAIVYNTDVQFKASGRDFLQDFLEIRCEGYSVHYATAATLLFRYYGIPARYVEGFLVTPSDIEGVLSNSPILIDETHAHAWVEFYQDGVGWIPFEATPPYLNIMEKDEELAGIPSAGQSQGSMEQKIDESEGDSNEGINEMNQLPYFSFIKWIVRFILGIMVLLLLSLIVTVATRRSKLKKRLKTFEDNNISYSIIQIFSYIVDIIMVTGVINHENELYGDNTNLTQWLMEDTEDFQKALKIYEEAKYSSHDMSDLDRTFLIEIKGKVIKKIQEGNGFVKNLKYRLFDCIY